MLDVHWLLRPLLFALCTAQLVLALLAYVEVGWVSLLVLGVVSAMVVAIQLPSLFFRRHKKSVAMINSVAYALFLGGAIWLGVVVVNNKGDIHSPRYYRTILSILSLASILLMGSSATLLWIQVRTSKSEKSNVENSDAESICTAVQSLKPLEVAAPVRKVSWSYDHKSCLRLPLSAALHTKASEGTLVVGPESLDEAEDVGDFNMIIEASLADTALYDGGTDNWMNTKPIPLSYSTPYLSQLRPLFSDSERKDGKSWYDSYLTRSSTTDQLRMKKQRLTPSRLLIQDDRLLGVKEIFKAAYAARLTDDVSSTGTLKVTCQHTKASDSGHSHSLQLPLHDFGNGAISPAVSDSKSTIHGSPTRLSVTMDGLEDIPRSAPQWVSDSGNVSSSLTPNHSGMRNISLDEWEVNKLAWMSHSHSAKPILYAVTSSNSLSHSLSAPSLHTYRQISEGTSNNSSDFASLDATFTHCIAPVVTPDQQLVRESRTSSSSPIKKMMGVFKRRDSMIEPVASGATHSHQHTLSISNSMASFLTSLASGKSTRSNSPRKSIKAFFSSTMAPEPVVPQRLVYPHLAPYNLYRAGHRKSMSQSNKLLPAFHSHLPDIEPGECSEGSRVSSIPSAIVGVYDKEKWRTLKELERQTEAELSCGNP